MVILVDEHDNELGLMEKQEAHISAVLHRAFSVLVFNNEGQMLLQQRAVTKYHSGGLWTNTCCSHPRAGETCEEAAHRRLMEEMGFDTKLKLQQKFIYKAPFDNGLTEHELDYVFTGVYNLNPVFNTAEVADIKWISVSNLLADMQFNPTIYTEWFKIIMKNYLQTNQDF